MTATVALHFDYTPHTTPNGMYYTLAGSSYVQVNSQRPVQPRAVELTWDPATSHATGTVIRVLCPGRG